MSNFCSVNTLKTIYFSLIESAISYGIEIYGGTSKQNLDRILILQKRAIRIIMNLNFGDSVRQHFTDLGIMTVYSLYVFHTALHAKKLSINNLVPRLGDSHSYFTRNRNQIAIDFHRLEFYNKKTLNAGAKFLLRLPVELRNVKDVKMFKKKLKLHLTNKTLYKFDEL